MRKTRRDKRDHSRKPGSIEVLSFEKIAEIMTARGEKMTSQWAKVLHDRAVKKFREAFGVQI